MGKKQGKGGKGSGAHAAKKAKYAAHKVGAARKGNNKKQTGGTITMKNKAARMQRHQRMMAKQQSKKDERLELLGQLISKSTNTKIGELSKKYGTLNIRRLTDILNNVAEDSSWYKARVARKEAEAQHSAKVVRKHVKFRKRRKEDKGPKGQPRQVQALHGRRDKRDRKVQVDQE